MTRQLDSTDVRESRLGVETAGEGKTGGGASLAALRGSDTRAEQILEAACRAIVRLGFESTRISDVAREAGTSTGTVHYHFDTKDDVLVAALTWANSRGNELIDEALAELGTATEKLALLIDASIPYQGLAEDWWTLWIELWTRVPRRDDLRTAAGQIEGRWRSYFDQVVREGVANGEFRRPGSVDDLVETMVALIDGLAFQAIAGYRTMPPGRMRELLVGFAVDELGADARALAPPPAGGRLAASRPLGA